MSGNAATIPTGYGQVRLTGTATAVVLLTGATSPAAVSGQQLVVYNPTTFQAVLNGQAIPAGRAASFVYMSGNWQASAGGADNLGNHTATQNLNMQGNSIVGTGGDIGAAIGVTAAGGLNIGQNTASQNIFIGYQSGLSNKGARRTSSLATKAG